MIVIPLFHHRVHTASNGRVQGLRMHQTPPQVRFEDIWRDGDVDEAEAALG